MPMFYVTRHGVVMAALAAAGVISAVVRSEHASAVGESMSCNIQVSRSGNLVGLKAIVSTPSAASGSYHLHVVSSGGNSSNIDQSGDFTVSGGPAVVSSVSLGGSGSYTARLSVTADGRTTECVQRVSGAL
jgi:hypothetical protein